MMNIHLSFIFLCSISHVRSLRSSCILLVTSSKNIIKWDAVKGADGYLVYSGDITTSADDMYLVDEVTGTSYSDGGRYIAKYAVVAYKYCGNDRVALSVPQYITILPY